MAKGLFRGPFHVALPLAFRVRSSWGGQKRRLRKPTAIRIVTPMITVQETPTNQKNIDRLKSVVAETLVEVLKRGFHGSAGVEWNVQDGTIQGIRRRVERIDRC
jgi:hypothetical protein